jgi:hypothetical protein
MMVIVQSSLLTTVIYDGNMLTVVVTGQIDGFCFV